MLETNVLLVEICLWLKPDPVLSEVDGKIAVDFGGAEWGPKYCTTELS